LALNDRWTAPVGHFIVGVEPADSGNSLTAVATMLIDYGVPAIPVVKDGVYCGIVFEDDLLRAASQGEKLPVDQFMRAIPSLNNRTPASEALRELESLQVSTLAVTDDRGSVLGVITASRLLATTDRDARPKLVGGLATPVGVRLLGGGVTGGVGSLAILGTGATMFLTYLAGDYVARAVAIMSPPAIQDAFWFGSAMSGIALFFFLVFLRSMPLSGYHAAEHMVVHAIEQGEPLELDTVARMPRVHPRCGTNIAVALGLFLGISYIPWFLDPESRTLIGLLAALFLFRPLGAFVQKNFTTRPPTEKQLLAGIQAGKDLLKNYQTASSITPPVYLRIWQSGMLHAIAGSMLVAILLGLITAVLPIPEYWRVISGI